MYSENRGKAVRPVTECLLASDPLAVKLVSNLHSLCVLWQIWIGLALRYDSFEVLFACKPEQPFAISVDVIAIQETFTALGHHCVKPELAVDQRKIAESSPLRNLRISSSSSDLECSSQRMSNA
jgi:hypothetical protein